MATSEVAPPPAPAPPTPAKPKIGDVNVLEACIGQRGAGKTTLECARAYELSWLYGGAYVIGHSMGPRLPRTLPASLVGREVTLPIRYYPTLRELELGLTRWPGAWHILAPPLAGEGHKITGRPDTADDLLKFSIRLSTAIRRRAWSREHPFRFWNPNVDMLGTVATPVIVIVDEGIAVSSAGAGRDRRVRSYDSADDDWFLKYLYSLRHLHIALLWNLQEPSSRSWRILEAATALYVFRVRHQWALNAIRAAGASDEQIEAIRRLPPYEHVKLDPADFDAPEAELAGGAGPVEPAVSVAVAVAVEKPGT